MKIRFIDSFIDSNSNSLDYNVGDKVNVFELEIFKLSFELFFEFELLLEESNLLTLIFTIEKSSSGLIKLNYIFNYIKIFYELLISSCLLLSKFSFMYISFS